jgi:hypothetical protein
MTARRIARHAASNSPAFQTPARPAGNSAAGLVFTVKSSLCIYLPIRPPREMLIKSKFVIPANAGIQEIQRTGHRPSLV